MKHFHRNVLDTDVDCWIEIPGGNRRDGKVGWVLFVIVGTNTVDLRDRCVALAIALRKWRDECGIAPEEFSTNYSCWSSDISNTVTVNLWGATPDTVSLFKLTFC